MKAELRILSVDCNDYAVSRSRFRFAVIDLEKSRDYPANFVCILPMSVSNGGKQGNIFFNMFGGNSIAQAKSLLSRALKKESSSEVKREIERRLKLLEPAKNDSAKCKTCGKSFEVKPSRRSRQKYCHDCLEKSYGKV